MAQKTTIHNEVPPMIRSSFHLLLPLALIALIIASCSHGNDMPKHRNHSFANIESYEKRFEDPARITWQKPDEVVRAMGLKDGDTVADIGAGTGYFTRRIAKAVAPRGVAIGYDVERGMVEYMRADAKKLGYANYHAELVAPSAPALPRAGFTVIFMCNTYHHIENRPAYVRSIVPALKKAGRIVIVDSRMEAKAGPPKHFRIPKEVIVAEFAKAGMRLVKDLDFLPDQHYLEFARK